MSLKKKSFSLIEVVFACGILIMFLAAGILITKVALRNAATNKDRLQAAMFANRIIEEVRAARDSVFFAGDPYDPANPDKQPLVWDDIKINLGTIYGVNFLADPPESVCFDHDGAKIECTDSGKFYELSLNFSEINLGGNLEKIVVNVDWPGFGIDKTISMPTYFMGCDECSYDADIGSADIILVMATTSTMDWCWDTQEPCENEANSKLASEKEVLGIFLGNLQPDDRVGLLAFPHAISYQDYCKINEDYCVKDECGNYANDIYRNCPEKYEDIPLLPDGNPDCGDYLATCGKCELYGTYWGTDDNLGEINYSLVDYDNDPDPIYSITTEINNTDAEGGVAIADALHYAQEELKDHGRDDPSVTKAIILATDGGTDVFGGEGHTDVDDYQDTEGMISHCEDDVKRIEGEGLYEAQQAREAGIIVYTIEMGKLAVHQFLINLASSPKEHYTATDPGSLLDIYTKIADDIHRTTFPVCPGHEW